MKATVSLLLLAIVLLFNSSCSKEDDSSKSYSDKIVLDNLKLEGSNIKLSWSKLESANFSSYRIFRNEIPGSTSVYYMDQIAYITDPEVTTFTDDDVPYTPFLEYQVLGIISTTNPNDPQFINSNKQTYERPDIKIFKFALSDVIPDLGNNLLYVFEADSGKINRLNFATESVESSVNTHAQIGYSDIGLVNGTTQIVVPRSDGWIFFYDAVTLSKTDQINFGSNVKSVVLNGNKVFAFGKPSANYYSGIKSFDCLTKQLISETHFYSSSLVRLKYIPGTNTGMYAVDENYYYDVYSYRFDPSGMFVSSKNYDIELSMDEEIIKVFPDGSKFITSHQGVIIDSALQHVVTLPYGNYSFSDFEFSESAGSIYCGCNNFKKIIEFSNPGYSQVREYSTNGYPVRIFRKGNELICLSRTAPIYYSGYSTINYMLERVQLQ